MIHTPPHLIHPPTSHTHTSFHNRKAHRRTYVLSKNYLYEKYFVYSRIFLCVFEMPWVSLKKLNFVTIPVKRFNSREICRSQEGEKLLLDRKRGDHGYISLLRKPSAFFFTEDYTGTITGTDAEPTSGPYELAIGQLVEFDIVLQRAKYKTPRAVNIRPTKGDCIIGEVMYTRPTRGNCLCRLWVNELGWSPSKFLDFKQLFLSNLKFTVRTL